MVKSLREFLEKKRRDLSQQNLQWNQKHMPSALEGLRNPFETPNMSCSQLRICLKRRVIDVKHTDPDHKIRLDQESLGAGAKLNHLYKSSQNFGDTLIAHKHKKQSIIPWSLVGRDRLTAQHDEFIQSRIKNSGTPLPEEWSVVQLTKSYSTHNVSLQSNEVTKENGRINISLKDPRNKNSEGIRIVLDKSQENIFSHTIASEIREQMIGLNGGSQNAERWTHMNNSVGNVIALLERVFGPWICLFCGINEHDHLHWKAIDQLLENKISQKNKLLTYHLARNVKMLSTENLCCACDYLGNGNKELSVMIYCLLKNIKRTPKVGQTSSLPVILIVDEILDGFPFEMLNPAQEICRLPSYFIAEQLYTKLKDRISGGYYNENFGSATCVVDPDNTLQNMQKRMELFFKHWAPSWECSYGKTTNMLDILNTLRQNLFVYCGHGSGFQFMDRFNVFNLISSVIVFLFGCDSVRLVSDGLLNECHGSHLIYHLNYCPAVIGTLYVVSDFQTDIVAADMLSSWIRKPESKTWKQVDKLGWKQGIVEFNDKEKLLAAEFTDRLPKVLANIRNNKEIILRMRSAFVYRGIPVRNF